MGEEFDLIDVDVRQRKSGKNKNQPDDIGLGGGGDGHGASKRRRRGRGGDRSEGIKIIPEEEAPSEPKDKKGKVPIPKNQSESDDEIVDDGDDAYYSSLEDEESSGSWLFKLIIIAIIVSLGLSLIWFNDGSSSSTDLDGIDANIEPLSDIGEGYSHEKVDDDEDGIRSDIDEANYQSYEDGQEYNHQWTQEYGSDSGSDIPEIIAEVSETIGQESSELNDETGYSEPRDEGYFEQSPNGYQESVGDWTNEQAAQPEIQDEEQLTSFKEPEIENENQQNDQSYDQQSWHYQDQVDHQSSESNQQSYEPYEQQNDEQLTQSTFESNTETANVNVDQRHYECPEGTHWDGLSCVNPESFIPMDEFNDGHEPEQQQQQQQTENTGGNIYYQEQQ